MNKSSLNNEDNTNNTNPQETQQPKQAFNRPNHSQHNHDQLDSDCEGCKAQKLQNQKLVDFYQRLDKISTKVKKFKSKKNPSTIQSVNIESLVQSQQKNIIPQQNLHKKLKELQDKLNIHELPSISQIKEFSSKEIGFELAAALIERQVRYKNQNKKLQERINELLSQKKKKEEDQLTKISSSSFFIAPKNDFTPEIEAQTNAENNDIMDSLDDFKRNKKINRKNEDFTSFWDIQNTSTKNGFKCQQTTFFQTKKRQINLSARKQIDPHQDQIDLNRSNNEKKKGPYNTQQGYGLNLWLYQFKADDYQNSVLNSWMPDKNKSQISQRYNNGAHRKHSLGNRSPEISNVNKTSIIQKNIGNDYSPFIRNKKKKY